MKVTSKGQVTIPRELRIKFGIDQNAEVDFAEEGGKIVLKLKRRTQNPRRALLGRGDVAMSTDEILSLTRKE